MRLFNEFWLKASVAEKLREKSRMGDFNGLMDSWGQAYLDLCTGFHARSGTVLIFTRDTGHHTSGWFKNPDYERCLHLSLSYREPFAIHKPLPHNARLSDEWCELFFGESRRLAWRESAKSESGRVADVVHWRVFCDAHWQPFHPRGEVYSLEFTEKDWKSWGELHPDDHRKEPSILHAG